MSLLQKDRERERKRERELGGERGERREERENKRMRGETAVSALHLPPVPLGGSVLPQLPFSRHKQPFIYIMSNKTST